MNNDVRITLKIKLDNIDMPIYQTYCLPKGRMIRLTYGENIPGIIMEKPKQIDDLDIGYLFEVNGRVGFYSWISEEINTKLKIGDTIQFSNARITVDMLNGQKTGTNIRKPRPRM